MNLYARILNGYLTVIASQLTESLVVTGTLSVSFEYTKLVLYSLVASRGTAQLNLPVLLQILHSSNSS